jgi:hypothetical protein
MNAKGSRVEVSALERQLARLAADRTALFRVASMNGSLTPDEQHRLTSTERQLDECFTALRIQRAQLDARRFENERALPRRPVGPPAAPKSAGKQTNV